MEWEKKGVSKKDFKKDMEGDVLSSSGQVQFMSGPGYSSNIIL